MPLDKRQWPAGIFRPGGDIPKLWDMLASGKLYKVASLQDAVTVKDLKGRLSWIERLGRKPVPNQTHAWRIVREGDTMQMVDLRRL